MPKKNERRIAICEDTKKKIIQEWTGTEWLCLHNTGRVIDGNELNLIEGVEFDKKEVKKFEATQAS